MLKVLSKIYLNSLFSYLFRSSRLKKKRTTIFKILVGFFAIYIIGTFFFLFGGFFDSICKPMYEAGFPWLYFGMAAIIATALCFIGSIFITKAQLFDATDNELLLSMPIPPRLILASRMVALFAINYLFELLVLAPAGLVYSVYYPITVTGVIFFIIGYLFLPLIVMTLSCILGWLLGVISARVRNKSLINTVISLLFLAAYFYFFSQMNKYIQTLVQNIHSISESIKNILFPIYHFGMAISKGSIVSLLFFLISAIVPFAIVYAILSHNFIKVVTTKKGSMKIKYKEQSLKVGNVKTALLKKELKHFSSNSMYILNASLGVVFTLAFAVALIIYRDFPAFIIQNMPPLSPYINVLMVMMLCFLASTNIISAPSVSLEGKNLWLVQSLPIDGGDVLLSKAHTHMVVCLPSVIIASIVCIFTLELSPLMMVLILILPVLVTIFCALFGVVINLHFPKFDWINETVAVKQGMSTLISMFASMAIIIVPALLYGFVFIQLITAEVFMVIYSIILAALCLLMVRFMKTRGKVIFAELG